MARKFALLSFTVLVFKLNENIKILKDACMIIIYVMIKKNAQPNITLRKWLTACHRKNVEVYNENR